MPKVRKSSVSRARERMDWSQLIENTRKFSTEAWNAWRVAYAKALKQYGSNAHAARIAWGALKGVLEAQSQTASANAKRAFGPRASRQDRGKTRRAA